ncbi:hypothetical protein [Hoeflea poritis]|uniref:Helix-turn-helix domain-containing protein n=1 Tax=Hoeflea poritis TaxID=2993659 RepID=A0ABT4VML8_9HYPH|nr:hypothetical protein [Hoeflea poritis]MDA4845926.1 hypothetical protein [Hoeflea poritis]
MSSGFTPISNLLADDEELPFDARGMMLYLLAKPPDWEVNVNNLINAGGRTRTGRPNTGRDRVYKILKLLCERGYISREKRRSKGGQFTEFEYVVYGDAIPGLLPFADYTEVDGPVTGNTEMGHPVPASPDVGLPDVGKSDTYKRNIPPNNKNNKTHNLNLSDFETMWRAVPHPYRPERKDIARSIFDKLPSDMDRAMATQFIATYVERCKRQDRLPKLIVYLTERLYRDLNGCPEFDKDGLFVITPDREEWDAWLEHTRAALGEVIYRSTLDSGEIRRDRRFPPSRVA